jgi:histidinol dehydrogenase
VLTRLDLRGRRGQDLAGVLPRAVLDVAAGVDVVRPVVDDVRRRGLPAVLEATARFDGVELDDVRVPVEELHQALAALDPAVRAALEEAARRARRVCEAQLRDDVVVRSSTARRSPSGGCPSDGWASTCRAGASPTRAAW